MDRRSFIKGSTMAGVAGLFSSDADAKLIASKIVDFPAPFGPIKPKRSPLSISKETFSKT